MTTSTETKKKASRSRKAAGKPRAAKPKASTGPRHPFGEWKLVRGQWIHYSGEAAVSEKRLVAKRVVRGKCDEFPAGQLMDMETSRRDDLLNSLRSEDRRHQVLFVRPDEDLEA